MISQEASGAPRCALGLLLLAASFAAPACCFLPSAPPAPPVPVPLTSAPSYPPSAVVPPPVAEPPGCPVAADLPALTAEATIVLGVVGDPSHPIVAGRTNLPDSTAVMVSVEGGGFSGGSRVEVRDGCFVSEPFGPAVGLRPGAYTVEALTPIVQPREVADALGGRDLPGLSGPAVRTVDGTRSLRVTRSHSVGGIAGPTTPSGAEVRRELGELLGEGEALEALREAPRSDLASAAACGTRMRGLLARVAATRERADAAADPAHPRSLLLRGAAPDVEMCVTCSTSARAACTGARATLAEYDARR